jgi:dTDP-glucose 4,6-dehydratase
VSRVLITGAAGFLGSHLAERFLNEGYEVIGVDNLVTGHLSNLKPLDAHRGFTFIRDDISKPTLLDGALAGALEGVLHFASPASPPDYQQWAIETLDVGSLGTRHCLELARAKNARFLLASTSEVYGDPPPEVSPQPETYWGNVNSVGPRSMYDEAKRFAEALTMAYRSKHGLETRIVRIFNTYGPRMRPNDGRVVSNFIVQALRGDPLSVYGDGSQTRSFCYVEDEVDGIWRLYKSSRREPTNIGNPNEFTIRELARIVLEEIQSSSTVESHPLPADDPKHRRPDITVARRDLGWEPKISLREGLRRTIPYFRALVENENATARILGAV